MPKVHSLRELCLEKLAHCVDNDSLPYTDWSMPSDMSNVVMQYLIVNEKWNYRTFKTMTTNTLFRPTEIDLTGISVTAADLAPFRDYQLRSVKIGDSAAPFEYEMPLVSLLFGVLGFSSMESVKSLDLSGRRAISPVWPNVISQFVNTNLVSINLANRVIPDTCFEQLCTLYTSLTCLDVSNTRISDFRFLDQLTQLQVFIAHNLNIRKNIENLSKLEKLKCLDVSVCTETPDVLCRYVLEETEKAKANEKQSPWHELISIDLGGTSLRANSLYDAQNSLTAFIDMHPNLQQVTVIGTKLQCSKYEYRKRPGVTIVHPACVISRALKDDRPEFVKRGFQILICGLHSHIEELDNDARAEVCRLAGVTMRRHHHCPDILYKVLECIKQLAWDKTFARLPRFFVENIVEEVFRVQHTHRDLSVQLAVWRVFMCSDVVDRSKCYHRLYNASLNAIIQYPGTLVEDFAMTAFLKAATTPMAPPVAVDEDLGHTERTVEILRELISYQDYNEECLRMMHMTVQTAKILLKDSPSRIQRFFNFGGTLMLLNLISQCSRDIDIMEHSFTILTYLMQQNLLVHSTDIFRFERTNDLFKALDYNKPQYNGAEPMTNIPHMAATVLIALLKHPHRWQSPNQCVMAEHVVSNAISEWGVDNISLEFNDDTFEKIRHVLRYSRVAPEVLLAMFELWHTLSKYVAARDQFPSSGLYEIVSNISENKVDFGNATAQMASTVMEMFV